MGEAGMEEVFRCRLVLLLLLLLLLSPPNPLSWASLGDWVSDLDISGDCISWRQRKAGSAVDVIEPR
jgi:hypothetical protein